MKSSFFIILVAILGSLSQLCCPASGAAAYLTFQKSTHGDAQLQIDENTQMDTTVSPPPLQMSPDQQPGGSSSQQLPVGAAMDTSSSDIISQKQESWTFKSNEIPNQSSNVEPLPQVLPDSRSSLTQSDDMGMSSGRDGFGMNINQPDDSSMMGFQDDSMSQSGSKKKLKSKSKKKTLVKQSDGGGGDDDSSSSSSPEEFSLFYKHDEINLVKPDQINSSSTSKVFMINGVPVDTNDQAGSSPVIQKLNDFVVNLQSVLLTLNQTATTSGGSNNQKVVESKSGKTSVVGGGMTDMTKASSKKKMKVKKTEKEKLVLMGDQSMTTLPYSSDGNEESDESDESDDE